MTAEGTSYSPKNASGSLTAFLFIFLSPTLEFHILYINVSTFIIIIIELCGADLYCFLDSCPFNNL